MDVKIDGKYKISIVRINLLEENKIEYWTSYDKRSYPDFIEYIQKALFYKKAIVIKNMDKYMEFMVIKTGFSHTKLPNEWEYNENIELNRELYGEMIDKVPKNTEDMRSFIENQIIGRIILEQIS